MLPTEDNNGVCAKVEAEQSNTWQQGHQVGWNFDIHIRFPLAEMEADEMLEKVIRIEWENDLTIQHLEPQGAVTFVGGGRRYVLVKPQPQYVGHDYFSVKGIRKGGAPEDLLEPTITCSGGEDVPPPSPPGPPLCDLSPQVHTYPIGSTNADGSRVTMKLSKWVPWRVFTLTYFAQDSLMVKKPEGMTLLDVPHHIPGVAQVQFTFTLNDQPSGGEACGGHPSCLEFEAHPAVLHHPHIECITKPPPSPPKFPPVAHSPPPPPPPIVHSPPPPPVKVTANFNQCFLGGEASVMPTHSDDPTKQSVRVLVTLDRWFEAAVVTVQANGYGLRTGQMFYVDAQPVDGPSLVANFAFSFKLRKEAPAGVPAFAFVLEGQRFDQLVALTCVQPQVQKAVPSSTPEPQEYTYDSTSLYDTSGDADSYGIAAGDKDPEPSPVATPIGGDKAGAGAGVPAGLFGGAGALVLVGALVLWRRRTATPFPMEVAVQNMIGGARGGRSTTTERAVFNAEDHGPEDGKAMMELNPAAAAAAAAVFADDTVETDPRRPPDDENGAYPARSARRPAV